ncbi:hypothetical protein scyTo_0005730 [Scyliorhinus torazame]|uniref:Uncharacterized protein n=1 Tax=Scyliorhinus torazame TaxID=75743 RepID=A0A401PBY6_SCYTO|nr:hypothetical protein [Scyliorhinus torazame]
MSARVWFVTDRRILQDYPQQEIERALRQKCAEEEVEFRMVLMDEIVITIEQGALAQAEDGTGDTPDLCGLPIHCLNLSISKCPLLKVFKLTSPATVF